MKLEKEVVMKLITFAVPCWNSSAYMSHCIDNLLATGAEDIEILIVDDGSEKDNTAEIADRYETENPGIVKAIHQENAGHGGAVMTGIRNASGIYYKVVDSDDWLDTEELKKVLETLRALPCPVDMFIANYIYDKVEENHQKVIRYTRSLPVNRIFTWPETKAFHKGEYMLMHALIYRTALLRRSGMELPKHTFYVDNLYAYIPMKDVRLMYYMDVDLYHYYIGRSDQSVNEKIMISRIDQQLRVNKMMADIDLDAVKEPQAAKYMYSYLEIITGVSSILIEVSRTEENYAKRKELWEYIRKTNPGVYKKLRYGIIGIPSNPKTAAGHHIAVTGYHLINKIFGFN